MVSMSGTEECTFRNVPFECRLINLCLFPSRSADSGDHLRAFKYHAPAPVAEGSRTKSAKQQLVGVNDVAFSSCSRYVAAAFDDGQARVWSVKSVSRRRWLCGHPPSSLRNSMLTLPVPLQGTCLRTLRHCSSTASSPVLSVAFSPKGSGVLATGGWDESVVLWDLVGRRRVSEGDSDDGSVRGEVEPEADGANVAIAIKTIAAHSDPISAAGFSADGSMLVTGSWDGLM